VLAVMLGNRVQWRVGLLPHSIKPFASTRGKARRFSVGSRRNSLEIQ